jgi:hypothetical protein
LGNTLKERALIVLRGARRPLSSAQVARILGLPTQQVTSPISRLKDYGHIEIAEVRDGERFYRMKEEAVA